MLGLYHGYAYLPAFDYFPGITEARARPKSFTSAGLLGYSIEVERSWVHTRSRIVE